MPVNQTTTADGPFGFGKIFRDELKQVKPAIGVPDQAPDIPNDRFAEQVQRAVDLDEQPLAALCLSGGGIRSAAFGLGVLQGLARFEALGLFHYLSTVSGGGYIGSWLSAWRHHAATDGAIYDGLNLLQKTGKEAPQIAGIRADSSYLTPRPGMLSPDTWATIALVIRNLVLNWLVFGPLFLGVLFIPLLAKDWIASVENVDSGARHGYATAGAVLALFGAIFSVIGRFRREGNWLSTGYFVRFVLAPATLASACFTLAAAPAGPERLGWAWIMGGATIYFVAWIGGRLLSQRQSTDAEADLLRSVLDLLAWTVAGAVVGTMLLLGIDYTTTLPSEIRGAALAVFGVLWCLLSAFTGELVYIGGTSFLPRSDMDREWLARAGGLLAATAVTWSVLAAIALYGSDALDWTFARATTAISALGIGSVSGIVTLALGASEKTAALHGVARPGAAKFNLVTSIAGLVFAIYLAVLLAAADAGLKHLLRLASLPSIDAMATAALVLLATLVSVFVNVNRFSLHAVYRNRLIRAFLGPARACTTPPRHADPFTGFDQSDNFPMANLRAYDSGRLLHVINITLNVVMPKQLGWQERKAEPFTVTSMACGNPMVGYRPTRGYGGGDNGITLGTAMAISGAAVSPNEGYHSSPVVGFLLMLFNVRLGWWLGNPEFSSYRKAGPKPGILPELQELAGATTDDRKWVYLSDGGHFDNLGLYEMIRRRCRVIVVSDAGADPGYAFEDLGNAVRKIFIDQGVSIEFEKFAIRPRQDPPIPGVYCAIGRVIYPNCDRSGWLLYVKPGYHGTERIDVRNYANMHPQFPHESTLNQWFSESQFESYRTLGSHVFEAICGGGLLGDVGQTTTPISDFDVLQRRAEAYIMSAAADIGQTGR